MHLTLQNWTLKNGYNGKFCVMCISSRLKISKIKRFLKLEKKFIISRTTLPKKKKKLKTDQDKEDSPHSRGSLR